MAIDLNNPQSREEALLTALISGQPVTINLNNPLSREEAILSAALLDQPYEGPINSRMEWLLNEWIKTGGGGDLQVKQVSADIVQVIVEPDEEYDGLSSVVITPVTADIDSNIVSGNIKKDVAILGVTGSYEPSLDSKTINTNGTYEASDDSLDGYSSVTVNVPNTYTAQDEGKVVSSGALVAQTANVPVTTNGTVDTTLISSVDVNVSTGGGASKSDVNFYDYDGTIVNSYSKSEFLALTEMPANPSHEGLTAQGWNWSLADAKTYVTSYGKLNVGQMYTTSDGATRLHIRLEDGRLSPVLGLCPNGTLTIDWGDGSTTETMTGNSTSTLVYLPHAYAQAGEYIISVTPSSGSSFGFGQRNNVSSLLCKSSSDVFDERRVYLNALTDINIGSSVTSISRSAFQHCYSLTSVTIPNSVTSIGSGAFNGCYSLTSATIPSGVTSIVDTVFQNCYSLTSVTIPSSITSISGSAFSSCYSLTSVTIPNGVTSIGSGAFNCCYSLTSVTIPSSITSISSSAFQYCYSLTSVTIQNSVTSIGGSAFSGCSGLAFIKFSRSTPPTVSASNAFSGIPSDCVIYAPALVLNLYMNGTNYPSKTTYKYIGYATYESGVTLPDKTTDETYTLAWYATVDDAIAVTNPITVGNGSEVYAIATAI